MSRFNDQNFSKLKSSSRFRETGAIIYKDSPLSPGVENKRNLDTTLEFLSTSQQFYDIKGNTFKNTLVPKQTALDSSLAFKTQGDWKTSLVQGKVKPQYKQGYVRSG